MCTNLRFMKDSYGFIKSVPCRYLCTECRNMRREDFSQRLKFEYKNYNYLGAFITLTYRDDTLPILLPEGSAIVGSYFGSIPPAYGSTLYRSDMSKFTDNMQKRLKRKYGRSGKYIGFGDYGEDGHRPHFHLIYIGCPCERRIVYDTWKKGSVKVLPITSGRIRYVLDYINKDPVFSDKKYDLYGDFEAPFYHYSKGLGFEEIFKMHEKGMFDELGKVSFTDKHTYTLPPYLRDKLGYKKNLSMYPESVVKWCNDKEFKDLDSAYKNRSNVVETVNERSIVAHGKPMVNFPKLQDNESLDRLNRFNGFTDYDSLDQIVLAV